MANVIDPTHKYKYVIDPIQKTEATFQKRLINFTTGHSEPLHEHTDWLAELAAATNTTKEFQCHIYGFASKLGAAAANTTLSYNRANAVAGFLEKANPLYTTRITQFQAKGEDGYIAPEGDDDPIWRAVEVHVFMQGTPVKPKPNVLPQPPKPVVTGLKWSVAAVAGFQNNPAWAWLPAQIQLNLFFFRNDETNQVGTYLAPMCGFGIDLLGVLLSAFESLKNTPDRLKALAKALGNGAELFIEYAAKGNWKSALAVLGKTTLLGGSIPIPLGGFSTAKVFLPMSHHKLDGADVASASVTATIKQYGAVWVSGKTWFKEASGKEMFATRDFLEVPGSWSTVLQIPNFGASFVGGLLIRLN